jgi:hypothetical protein
VRHPASWTPPPCVWRQSWNSVKSARLVLEEWIAMRRILPVAFLAILVQPALAGTREDILAAMQRCQSIAEDRAWLDCTYGAEQPMRAKLGLPAAPDYQQRLVPPPSQFAIAAAPRPAPPAAVTPHRGATFMQILTGDAPPLIVSTLAAVQYDAQGGFLLTLENGQVWRQADSDGGPKARFKIGDRVTIRPGLLHSYNLQAGGNPHAYKAQPQP